MHDFEGKKTVNNHGRPLGTVKGAKIGFPEDTFQF